MTSGGPCELLFLDKTVPVATTTRGIRATRGTDSEGRGGETRLNVSDVEKSPLFFLEASRPRMQLVVSLKDFSVFDERVFTSWSVSFGKNSPSSRQINSSTLIYLRRVIRWLSRLLALICSCLRDICALSVKIWYLQQMFVASSY